MEWLVENQEVLTTAVSVIQGLVVPGVLLAASLLIWRRVQRWVATCLVVGLVLVAVFSVTGKVVGSVARGYDPINVDLILVAISAHASEGIGWLVFSAGFLGLAFGVRAGAFRPQGIAGPGNGGSASVASEGTVRDRLATTSYVSVAVSLTVLALTLPWFGFSLLIRAAPHGDKALTPFELGLDLSLAAIPAVFALAAILLSRHSRQSTRGVVWLSVAGFIGVALELYVPILILAVWGMRT